MRSFLDSRYSQLAAYVLIVLIAVIGFARISNQQNEIEDLVAERTEIRNQQAIKLCEEAKATRESVRSQISAVSRLGQSLLTEDNPRSDLLRQRFLDYEETELADLPSITCPRPGDLE